MNWAGLRHPCSVSSHQPAQLRSLRERLMRRRDVLALGLSSLPLSLLRARVAAAQGRYPDAPIRLIVPRAAGGVVDVVARLWAEQVKPVLGNVVIENQGGGGGIIAAQAV